MNRRILLFSYHESDHLKCTPDVILHPDIHVIIGKLGLPEGYGPRDAHKLRPKTDNNHDDGSSSIVSGGSSRGVGGTGAGPNVTLTTAALSNLGLSSSSSPSSSSAPTVSTRSKNGRKFRGRKLAGVTEGTPNLNPNPTLDSLSQLQPNHNSILVLCFSLVALQNPNHMTTRL